MIKRIYRWRLTMRALRSFVLVSAVVLGGKAAAQGPPSTQFPKMTYTKNTVFHLPVQMEERTRANLREVCLYVKSGTSDWVRQETGLPTITHFSYKVPHDGEYWFSLVTIDKSGRMTPPDVSQEPPGLRVMVDTRPPLIEVQPWTSPEHDFCLRCQIQDANPDPKSLKAVYRDQTGEHVLEPMPGNTGVFKIPNRDFLNQPLRITAADLCGNVGTCEVNLREALQQTQAAVAKVIPASGTNDIVAPPSPPVTLPPESIRNDAQRPPLPPPPLTEKSSSFAGAGSLPNASPIQTASLPSASLPPIPPLPGAANDNPLVKQAVASSPGPANKQMLNTTRATIDYKVDQVGHSGISKVEVYLTNDGGQSWQRHQEDPDRRTPAEVDLPGEGLFGVRLVITNGNGFGGTPPARGDSPMCWIEVDTTAPFIQMRPIDPVQNGVIELRWTASDKNLGAEPIDLYYKTRPDGPWQVIQRKVKNDGLYRWVFPRDQGAQFFVKIEVSDLAGNSAHAETASAIVLDTTEPHALVVGVSGTTSRVALPGN
jgi:hypothetical protein